MTLVPTPLASLDPITVNSASSLLAELLLEFAPAADLRRGVLGDTVQHLSAAIWADLNDYAKRSMASATLQGVLDDPAGVDPDLAASVLSNYRLTVGAGSKASGQVLVEVSAPITLTVPRGATFLVGGLVFVASRDYHAVASMATSNGPDDVPCLPTGNGTFSFTVGVTAAAVGTSYNLPRGTPVTAQSAISGLLSARAATDLAGGTDTASLSAIAQQARLGVASAGFSSASAIATLLRKQAGLAALVDVSAVGQGDQEQRRHHTLFPVAVAGRVDAFVRAQALPVLVTVTLPAVLVSTGVGGGLWQLSIGRDAAPGFYEVVSVAGSNYTIIAFDSIVRGFDLTGLTRTPDIVNGTEAAFSRYQTATVRFVDSRISTAGLSVGSSTADYTVVLRVLPGIDMAQEALDDVETGSFGLDTLARAPVPCLVSVGISVHKSVGEADPDVAAIQQDLASLINAIGFAGSVTAASFLAAIARRLTSTQTATSIEITGRMLYPDGTVQFLRDAAKITAPSDPTRVVSARTVSFFLDPADVLVSVSS